MGLTVENFSLDGKIPVSRHLLQMYTGILYKTNVPAFVASQ
jgi:hypothetical protein